MNRVTSYIAGAVVLAYLAFCGGCTNIDSGNARAVAEMRQVSQSSQERADAYRQQELEGRSHSRRVLREIESNLCDCD